MHPDGMQHCSQRIACHARWLQTSFDECGSGIPFGIRRISVHRGYAAVRVHGAGPPASGTMRLRATTPAIAQLQASASLVSTGKYSI
jgi:hypothetical protein